MLCPARLDPHDVVDDEDGEDGDARLSRTSIPCAYAWPGVASFPSGSQRGSSAGMSPAPS